MDTSKRPDLSPTVISPTAQEFNGERYYLCGFYFQRNGRRLHRAVWKYNRGDIPKGYHVHHRDNCRSNNAIENLELLTAFDHLSLHGNPNARLTDAARAKAAEWHGSDEGRLWHSRHYRESIAPTMAKRTTLACQHCGQPFEARLVLAARSKFCGNNCKARALRKRRAIEREAKRLLSRDK